MIEEQLCKKLNEKYPFLTWIVGTFDLGEKTGIALQFKYRAAIELKDEQEAEAALLLMLRTKLEETISRLKEAKDD